jgi:muramoyltetrapeptide carboxypeptidase
MQIPAYLKKGDTVAIIATARKISKEEIEPAILFLKSYGLSIVCGEHLFKVDNQFAGTDLQRSSDLQWTLNHKDIKAIIIARGGYGTIKLLENIDFTAFKNNPKWIVGYSDVTVLHSAIHLLGIASLQATMPINFSKNKDATKSLVDALFGEYQVITCEPNFLNKEGTATGELVGGNLSLLYALSGTPYEIDTTDKILFIEDIDEYLYHIDRMMMQLKLSGKLKHLKGLVVGGMTDMKDNTVSFGKIEEEIILDAVKEYDYPVCFNFPAGHVDKNLALYFGKEIKLEVKSNTVNLNFLT